MVAIVGNTVKGTINISYKVIIGVLIEVHFKIITRRSTIFVKSQIASQLDTPLMSERRYITSFIKIQEILEIVKLL
jgi:hypothetical protein